MLNQDLVPKRTQVVCAFLIKWHLCVGAGFPSHTSVFFPMMVPFLEAPNHQNSSNSKKVRERQKIPVKIMGKVTRASGRIKGMKSFGSHL